MIAFLMALVSSKAEARSCLSRVRVAISSLPDNIPDPIFSKSIADAFFYRQILEGLVAISEDGHLRSSIAQSWKISSDGLIYEFHLDPQAKFADGSPIRAEDVAFSLSRPLWSLPKSHNKGILGSLIEGGGSVRDGQLPTGIAVRSDSVLEIRLRKPYPPFLKILAYSLYGIVKLDPRHEHVTSTSGPLMIKERDDSYVELEKNVHFALSSGCFPRAARFQKNTHPDKVSEDLDSGRIDVAFGYANLRARSVDRPLSTMPGYRHLFLNKTRKSFHDEEFRKNFVDQVWAAFDSNMKSVKNRTKWRFFMPPTVMMSDYYQRSFAAVSTPEIFKSKWCAQGCKEKFDVVLMKDGNGQLPVAGIHEYLQKAGLLNVRVRLVELKEWFEILRSGKFDLIEASYLGTYSDPDSYLSPLIGDNAIVWLYSGELKTMIESVRFTPSEAQRKKMYGDVLRKFEDGKYFVPLQYFPVEVWTAKNISLPSAKFKYDMRLDVVARSMKD